MVHFLLQVLAHHEHYRHLPVTVLCPAGYIKLYFPHAHPPYAICVPGPLPFRL